MAMAMERSLALYMFEDAATDALPQSSLRKKKIATCLPVSSLAMFMFRISEETHIIPFRNSLIRNTAVGLTSC